MFDSNRIKNILENTQIDNSVFNISISKNGFPVLKIITKDSSFYINSKYNPEKEAVTFAKEYLTPSKNIFVYGIGMGFHIKSLANKLTEKQHLYIVECNPSLIKTAFEHTNISEVLKRENITFIAPANFKEAVSAVSHILKKEDSSFICHEPSLRIIPDTFLEIKEIFETYIIKTRSNKVYGHLLSENEKINLTKGYKNGGKIFKDKFKGKPAIIVSAGPSLEINGGRLKNIKEKAIIISVGRSLKYLKSIGVKPDFTIITDPQGHVINQLDLNETSIPLFFLSTIHPSVENYKGEKYILFEELSEQIHSEEEKSFAVETGGSVATTALSLARLMGCSPLILIGQDLCYHSEKMHSGEGSSFLATKNQKIVKGIDGNNYPSPQNLYEYLKWFRKFAKRHPETKLINCTAKGAFIDGFEHKKIDELF